MRCEKLDVQEALTRGGELPWAYLRTLSRVSLGTTPRSVSLDGLLEARFFDEDREIRIFKQNGSWKGIALSAEPEDVQMTEHYKISNSMFGSRLTVIHQLDADEDGQTYVKASRLAGWEGAGNRV